MQKIVFFLVLFLTACIQQKPEAIKSSVKDSNFLQSSKACAKANLKTNLADKENSILIFKCIGWDKEFPQIFTFIENLPDKDYAQISETLNKVFFNSKGSKDKLFELLTDAGKKDDFESFRSFILNLIADDGVFELLEKIIKDLSNKNKSWLFLLEDKKLNQQYLDLFFQLKKNLKIKYADIEKYKKVYHSSENQNIQFQLVDSFIKTGFNAKTLKIIASFSNHEGWPYNWMQQLSGDDFKKLFFHVGKLNESIFEETRFLRSVIFTKIECHEYSGNYVFDHGKELRSRVQNIVDLDIDAFYADYIDLLQSFSLFKNVCSQTRSTNPEIAKLVEATDALFKEAHQIFSMHGGFELIKNVVRVTIDETLESSGAMMELMYSRPFVNYVALVKNYNQTDLGIEYFTKWIQLLKDFDFKILQDSSFLLSQLSKRSTYLESFQALYISLDDQTKKDFRTILLDFILKLEDQNINHQFFNNIITYYPDLLDVSHLNESALNAIILYFANELKNPKLQHELEKFLHKDSLFQLIRLMGSIEKEEVFSPEVIPIPNSRYVLDANEDLETCFKWLGSKLESGVNFWDLLDSYPKKCERNVGQYLSTHVLNWTIIIDSKFENLTNRKFSVPYGVISPEMMEYYLDLVLLINKHLKKEDSYLEKIVINIQKHLYELGLLEVLENAAIVLNKVNADTKFLSKSLFNFAVRDANNGIKLETDVKKFVSDYLNLDISENPTHFENICHKLNAKIMQHTCIDEDTLGEYFEKLSEQLLAKNWADKDPLQLMLAMFYPNVGLKLPYNRRTYRPYHVTLNELVRFLYDISDPSFQKELTYFQENGSIVVNTTIVERLEILIREIAFLDNFYGAYFMNKVARAKNYESEVFSLKDKMNQLSSMGNTMRAMGVLPKESRWMIKNTLTTYDSLIEVAKPFVQPEGHEFSHKNFVQALMVMVVESTNSDANNFTAYRLPNTFLVKKHRGKIITMSTELSLLTRASILLRRFFPNKRELLSSPEFQKLSQLFPKLMSYNELYNLTKFLLAHKNSKILLQDFHQYLDTFTPEKSKYLLDSMGSFIRIQNGCEEACYDKFSSIVTTFVENYHVIRKYFNKKDFKIDLNKLSKTLLLLEKYSSKNSFDYLIKFFKEFVELNQSELNQLIANEDFWKNLGLFSNSLINYLEQVPEDDTDLFFKKLLNDPKLNFSVFPKLVQNIYAQEGNLDFFDQLIVLMSHKENDHTNLYWAMNEIFVEKQQPLINFLKVIMERVSNEDFQIYRPLD